MEILFYVLFTFPLFAYHVTSLPVEGGNVTTIPRCGWGTNTPCNKTSILPSPNANVTADPLEMQLDKLRKKASMVVGVIFVPSLLGVYLFCRYGAEYFVDFCVV